MTITKQIRIYPDIQIYCINTNIDDGKFNIYKKKKLKSVKNRYNEMLFKLLDKTIFYILHA